MWKITVMFLLFICFKISKFFSQSIKIDREAIRFIVHDDSIFSGTGFNILKPNYILTCAHVLDTIKKITYQPPWSTKI